MKKVLYCLVIAVLAVSSAFAFTATNWGCADEYLSQYVSDYAGNGFSVDIDDDSADGIYGMAQFSTESVDGWVYDRNEPIYTVITGFEELFVPDSVNLYSDGKFVFLSVSFVSPETPDYAKWGYTDYKKPWTGAGEYVFTPEDITRSYLSYYDDGSQNYVRWDGLDGVVYYIDAGIMYDGDPRGSGDPWILAGSGTEGTFRFGRAETVVPEPATAAYGIMGLVSLIGMKKRFGK
ncbi:MAG: hypothetical protein J6U98_02000 [Abditibacteriota bacterium]|nr:hypothetical protein [Abditibacteriota bacterium]